MTARHVICLLRPAPMIQRVKNGAILQTSRNTPEGTERLKSHHYLNNILAKTRNRGTPDIEGIFLTEKGYVAEGIHSNVFWTKKNVVYTPSCGNRYFKWDYASISYKMFRKAGNSPL